MARGGVGLLFIGARRAGKCREMNDWLLSMPRAELIAREIRRADGFNGMPMS